MVVMEIKRNLVMLCCCKAKVSAVVEPKKKKNMAKHPSLNRLLLSDVSDPISFNDLSLVLNCPKLCVFTFDELRDITSNFSNKNYLGEGGFGRVYKGRIKESIKPGLQPQTVAVKVLDVDGPQGHMEWLAEVVFLGQIRHPHLVKLIGYCCEDDYRLLVYEYVALGSLESRLFNRYLAPLSWRKRMKIAFGAAKGLAFLHEEQNSVIYRDFKASNILLDREYRAKLSDFGLATDGSRDEKLCGLSPIRGTQGYIAPDYLLTGRLTVKSDVYSFGVVLLELLSGRQSTGRKHSLVEWARPLLKSPKTMKYVMDPRLEEKYPHEGAKKASKLAHRCLHVNPKSRPTMKSVVRTLEQILELNSDTLRGR
ncbi:hypothetical protein V2J09_004592 [Rumex salicifolius]